eukprot:5867210-Heterocapsa_arctica.AAC.1
MLSTDWCRPWNEVVSASYASESGYGISTARWPRTFVAETACPRARAVPTTAPRQCSGECLA